MKCRSVRSWIFGIVVAPLAGAWIEILDSYINDLTYDVAPLAGAWIEIEEPTAKWRDALESLPSRERGLKYKRLGSLTVHDLSLPSRERGLK